MSFAERVEPFLEAAGAAFSSDTALLVYSWLLVFLIVTASIAIGIRRFFAADTELRRELRAILNRPGPNPSRAETIQLRKDARNEVLKTFMRQLSVTAFFVMGIPLIAIALVSVCNDWFFPGQVLFVDRSSGESVATPSGVQLFLFVLDQLLKGALLDFMEVFRIQFSAIENATANWPYSGLVLGFRVLIDFYALAIIAKVLSMARMMALPLERIQ